MPNASRKPTPITLTPTDPDPLASLRIWGAEVSLGDQDFLIPALPAARWLEILLDPDVDPEAWFPGLCDPAVELAVWQHYDAGGFTRDEFEVAIWDALEQVSGRRWWVTLRLCMSVRLHWEWVGGVFALAGLDASRMSLGAWLDAAYKTMLDGILEWTQDRRKVGEWNRALTAPPPGAARRVLDDEENGNAFLAAFKAAR